RSARLPPPYPPLYPYPTLVRSDPLTGQPGPVPGEVPGVGVDGVPRQAALEAQGGQVRLEVPAQVGGQLLRQKFGSVPRHVAQSSPVSEVWGFPSVTISAPRP